MAYLYFSVGGNPDFGGYMSVDGSRSILIKDDMVYELDDGVHAFSIHSTSDAKRASGRAHGAFNSIVGTDGFMGAVNRAQAMNAMGDEWNFQARAEGDEVVVVEIVTRGDKIISTPEYQVTEFKDEIIESWKVAFEEQHKEEAEKERKRQEELSRPRRSKPKIIVGSILSGIGVLTTLLSVNDISNGTASADSIAPWVVILGVGVLLLILGLRKKVRR